MTEGYKRRNVHKTLMTRGVGDLQIKLFRNVQLIELCPSFPRHRQRIARFLADNSLRLDDIDYYVALEDESDNHIIGGGGLKGDTIKCVAVDNAHKGENIASTIVSHLIAHACREGYSCVRVFTKPCNRQLFENLSFQLLAEAPEAVIMQTGVDNELKRLSDIRDATLTNSINGKKSLTGIAVMNCNPFTLGHQHLIRQAAQQVDLLYVMPVLEDCSEFTYAERKAMIEAATNDMDNVRVIDGSRYAVSRATFPTYFLKQLSTASDNQMMLDLDLFRRHIAPRLGVNVRFIGSEPTDDLTARYNVLMHQMLERVVEMPRLQINGQTVSASSVRQALHEGRFTEACRLTPRSTWPFLLAHLATRALTMELDTTPKPGLVDRHDSGAHNDMDYALMSDSIHALCPFFLRLAQLGFSSTLPSLHDIRNIGIEGEKAMLSATGGINTHRGALFCMGVTLVAMSHMAYVHDGMIAGLCQELCHTIALVAHAFPYATHTHGSNVQRRYGVRGALDMARTGYATLFDEWLPVYQANRTSDFVTHTTLLHIMSTLDDTNILHRTDMTTLQCVKAGSKAMLHDFSVEKLQRMNNDFIRQNISPGGSADMLALTIFVDSVVSL